MFKNMDYVDTYSYPDCANIRYPSSASQSINGWAYVLTKDDAYVYGLAQHHRVEVRIHDRWVAYAGKLPDEELNETDSPPYADIEDFDPNY